MAIQRTSDSVYLRVVSVNLDKGYVRYELYKDSTVRADTGIFDKVIEDGVLTGTLQSVVDAFTTTGNIKDDLISCGYLALKNEPPFNGASGETWSDC